MDLLNGQIEVGRMGLEAVLRNAYVIFLKLDVSYNQVEEHSNAEDADSKHLGSTIIL